jgi:hypothetical protein
MSQQQLDYARPSASRRSPLWQRGLIALAIAAACVAATPKLVDAAWMSAGAGHGDYFWFMVLYPFPIWAARIFAHDLSGFVETLMYLQFPVYGVVIGASALRSKRWMLAATGSVAIVHGVAVALEFIVGV